MRGSETEESLLARVNKSAFEMTFKSYFENVVINNDFDEACKQAEKIVSTFLNNE